MWSLTKSDIIVPSGLLKLVDIRDLMNLKSFLDYCRLNGGALLGAAFLMAVLCGPVIWYSHLHPHSWTYEHNPTADLGEKAVTDYKLGRYEEAEIGFRAATILEPTRMELWYNLGNACFKQGKYQQAMAAYLRAYDLAPTDPDIFFNMNLTSRKMMGAWAPFRDERKRACLWGIRPSRGKGRALG